MTTELAVLSWNQYVLYPQGTIADQLRYRAKLRLPHDWHYGTALGIARESGDEVEFRPVSLTTLIDSPVSTGAHYRTEIFPQTEEQAKVAKAYIAQLDAAKSFPAPIVTKTGTMKAAFYPAEAYHQDYATLHPNNPYIVFNDAPKVENLKRMFQDAFRDKPVLVADAAKSGH